MEANIAAIILHSWVPGVPVWLFSWSSLSPSPAVTC
ncbi:hypothetical protein LOF13_21525 [Klebsiella pneumoniae subsp. pneumoniae]|nr:hypothetical protein LOF13_21525 [Klebsiella pneumoniae subsp. pneumoniae]